jgi:hypothetical protein
MMMIGQRGDTLTVAGPDPPARGMGMGFRYGD